MVGWFVGCLVGCLVAWLVVWLVGCLVGWLVACLVGWLVGCLVGWLGGWLFVWLLGWLIALLVGRLVAWLGLGLGLGLTQPTLDPTCTNTTPKKSTLLQRSARHQQYLPHQNHLTDNQFHLPTSDGPSYTLRRIHIMHANIKPMRPPQPQHHHPPQHR